MGADYGGQVVAGVERCTKECSGRNKVMPKIKNINYYIGNEKKVTAIHYETNGDSFYLSLPTSMFCIAELFIAEKQVELDLRHPRKSNSPSSGGEYQYGGVDVTQKRLVTASQSELEKLLKEYVSFYEKAKTAKRKVIVADFEYKSDDIRWSRGGDYQDEGYSFIRFKYWVATEYNNNGRIDYINDADGKSLRHARYRPDYFKIIPYSEESELFMKNFYEGMNQLMKNIGKYCGSTPALLNTISKGTMLLGSPPDDKKKLH
jgi:hypothetical protein